MSEAQSSWGSFADTVLDFRCRPPLVLDLRKPIERVGVTRLGDLGFGRSFGIVTAENPRGRALPEPVNAVRIEALRAEVAGLGVAWLGVVACSPDRSHCEESIAISIEMRSLIGIAQRYDQLAVFWFDGAAFWIEPVRSSNARLRLPVSI